MTNEEQAAATTDHPADAEEPKTERPSTETEVTEAAEAPEAAEAAAPEGDQAQAMAEEPAADEPTAEQSAATPAPSTGSSDDADGVAPEPPAEATAPSADVPEAADAPAAAGAADTAGDPAAAPAPAQPEPEPELSHEELAKKQPELAPVLAALESGNPIAGKVIGWNKGGFHVALDGVPAFCPKSQMEIGNPKRAHAYLDRDLEFTVAEIRENGKRIVVHRKSLLRKQRESTLEELRGAISSGEPVEGKVTSVTDFGAFVDIGGIEGLVHLSQLSRQRVDSPSDAVQVGQDVKVKVLKIEKGGDRISLSMKALEPDPWKSLDQRFEVGDQFKGTIVRATDFGLFVDVGDGIEGLLHTSQLAIGKSLSDYSAGSEISGWVRDLDKGRRRLSLSMREVAKGNPWADVKSRYEEGQEIEGQVEQVAKFGVFVLLEPGISGLLPFSATNSPMGARQDRGYTPGSTVRLQIASIDAGRRRISLAPLGSKLEGTKADLKEYQEKVEPTGMNAMAAAFAKLQDRG